MKKLVWIYLLLLSQVVFAGKGFLGYSQQVLFSVNDYVTDGSVCLEYNKFINRQFGFSLQYSYLNNSYLKGSEVPFSYTANRNGNFLVKGSEVFIGFAAANKEINNVIPVGITAGLRVGGGFYTTGEVNSEGDKVYSEIKSKQLLIETYVRNTFNIYDRLNLYIGVSLGQNIGKDEIPFVSHGINKNYLEEETFSTIELYYKIQYGLTLMF